MHMLANQVVKQLTNDVCQLTHQTLFFTLNIKALSLVGAFKMSTTLVSWCLFYCSHFCCNKRKYRYMTWNIHFFLSISKSLDALHVIAVHSCKRLPDEKTGNNNLFLRIKPNVFFFLFVGSYKVEKLNVSTSSGNLQGSILRTFS